MGHSLNSESLMSILNKKKTPRAPIEGQLTNRQSLPAGTNIMNLFHPQAKEEKEIEVKPIQPKVTIPKPKKQYIIPSQY